MPVADKAGVPAAPEVEVPAAAVATVTTRGRPGVRAATPLERAPSRPPIRGAHLSRKTRLSNRLPTCPTRARSISRRAFTHGQRSTREAHTEEEVQPASFRPEHRLQGHRYAAEVHLRARQDPRSTGDRPVRTGAAPGRHRHQERPRGCAAAVRLDGSLSQENDMKLILTAAVDKLGLAGDVVEVKDG